MTRSSKLAKSALALCLLIPGYTAVAAPYGCVTGYEDNTCIQPIHAAAQTPPTCSTADGWTKSAAAHWIGSGFAPPQCSYQSAPTCPTGFAQTSAPVWNGSSWVGLSCSLPPPPPPTDPRTACAAGVPADYTQPPSFSQDTALNQGIDNYDAQQAGISGYSVVWQAYPSMGPTYATACGTASKYRAVCYTRSDNSVAGLLMVPTVNTSSGQCNH